MEKIKAVKKWFNPDDLSNFQPIPIKELNGKLIYIDGHTRAFLAYKAGLKNIPLYWETEELGWDLYQACVDGCNKQGIYTIKDLENRILSGKDYELLWDKWCDDLHLKIKGRL